MEASSSMFFIFLSKVHLCFVSCDKEKLDLFEPFGSKVSQWPVQFVHKNWKHVDNISLVVVKALLSHSTFLSMHRMYSLIPLRILCIWQDESECYWIIWADVSPILKAPTLLLHLIRPVSDQKKVIPDISLAGFQAVSVSQQLPVRDQ